MATVEVSIVTRFGDGVASDALVVVEPDEVKNVDAAGEVKSEFAPGESAWLLVHMDEGLRVAKVECSGGAVQILGEVRRSREHDLQFPAVGDTVTLSYNPDGSVTSSWDDRDGKVRRVGRVLTAAAAPAIGTATYMMVARQLRFVPPAMDLAVGDQHRVLVVIYIETEA